MLHVEESRGGVMAYVKSGLHPIVSEINTTPCELLLFNIYPSASSELLIGVYYRYELAGLSYFDIICDSLIRMSTTDTLIVCDSKFCDINWESIESFSPLSSRFLSAVFDNCLQQMVNVPARMNYIND